jgi:hypothetical protein
VSSIRARRRPSTNTGVADCHTPGSATDPDNADHSNTNHPGRDIAADRNPGNNGVALAFADENNTNWPDTRSTNVGTNPECTRRGSMSHASSNNANDNVNPYDVATDLGSHRLPSTATSICPFASRWCKSRSFAHANPGRNTS